MTSEISKLVDEMMFKGHIYIDAIRKRDRALAQTFETEMKEDIDVWERAMKAAQHARAEYDAVIQRLHAARGPARK